MRESAGRVSTVCSSRRVLCIPFVLLLALVSLSLVPVASASPPADAFRFFHDADGRLKAAVDPEGDTAIFSWDAVGNLLSIDRHSSEELEIVQLSSNSTASKRS